MSDTRWLLLWSLVALSVAAESVQAQQKLYGITWTNELITIDTTTGAGTLVGLLQSDMKPAGLAFRGSKLYVWDNNAKRVQEILPATAVTWNTIDIGVNFFGEGDMVFRSDGTGFLTGFSPLFYSFDVTAPSSIALPALNPTFDGLAFDSKDVLYGMSQAQPGTAQLYTIDTVTGVATLIGDTGLTGFPSGGLAFDAADNLYAAFANGAASIYRINTTTAAPTLVGNNLFGIVGIRFGSTGPGVTITESGGSTNVTEGGTTDSYSVVLNTAPTAPVTITINPGTQVSALPATLTFTPLNWNVAQTVTVTAVDDALVEGAHVGPISHTSASGDPAYNALVIANVAANITDNDAGPLPTPGGGINEGNYPGSHGLGNGNGKEGTFGFGRSYDARLTLQPRLIGPYRDPAGFLRVANATPRQRAITGEADNALGALGWSLLAGSVLAAGTVTFGRRFSAKKSY